MTRSLKHALRRLGVGKLWLGIHQLRALTMVGAVRLQFARRRYLRQIESATPIPAGAGEIEIHTLLHHQRIYEGLWSLYSFASLVERSCRIVIHDDGSLTATDIELLDRVFPGLRVIKRAFADEALETFFRQQKLERCARFRSNLIFALKLFDPIFFAENDWFVLMDSDVLFYRKPVELLQGLNGKSPRSIECLYSRDNGYRYCLEDRELLKLLGKACIAHFNPGIVRVRRGIVNFEHFERWLSHPGFWTGTGAGNYYGELTLWAMALTLADAQPLPDSYAICSPEPEQVTYGHYCGGGFWASLFYTRGIPYLKKLLLDPKPVATD